MAAAPEETDARSETLFPTPRARDCVESNDDDAMPDFSDVVKLLTPIVTDAKYVVIRALHEIMLLCFAKKATSNLALFTGSPAWNCEECCFMCSSEIAIHVGDALRYVSDIGQKFEHRLAHATKQALQTRMQSAMVVHREQEAAAATSLDGDIPVPNIDSNEIMSWAVGTQDAWEAYVLCLRGAVTRIYTSVAKTIGDMIALYAAEVTTMNVVLGDDDVIDIVSGFDDFTQKCLQHVVVLFDTTILQIVHEAGDTIDKMTSDQNRPEMDTTDRQPHVAPDVPDNVLYQSLALAHAMQTSLVEVAGWCLANGADPLAIIDIMGRTPLDIIVDLVGAGTNDLAINRILALTVARVRDGSPIAQPWILHPDTMHTVLRILIDGTLLGDVIPNSTEHLTLVGCVCNAVPMMFDVISDNNREVVTALLGVLFANATDSTRANFCTICQMLARNGLSIDANAIIGTLDNGHESSYSSTSAAQMNAMSESVNSAIVGGRAEYTKLVYAKLTDATPNDTDVITMIAKKPQLLLVRNTVPCGEFGTHTILSRLIRESNWERVAIGLVALSSAEHDLKIVLREDTTNGHTIEDDICMRGTVQRDVAAVVKVKIHKEVDDMPLLLMIDPGIALVEANTKASWVSPDEADEHVCAVLRVHDVSTLAAMCCNGFRARDTIKVVRQLLTSPLDCMAGLWKTRIAYDVAAHDGIYRNMPMGYRQALLAHIITLYEAIDPDEITIADIKTSIRSGMIVVAIILAKYALDKKSILVKSMAELCRILESHVVSTVEYARKQRYIIPLHWRRSDERLFNGASLHMVISFVERVRQIAAITNAFVDILHPQYANAMAVYHDIML